MTGRVSVSTAWALVPVMLWIAHIFAGLLAGSDLCAAPTAIHGVGALLVAVSGFAVYRSWSLSRNEPEDESLGLVGRIVFMVGVLFTAGIALSWLMTGFGTCL